MFRRVLLLAGFGLSSGCGAEPAPFDYYLLALSWSPQYCLDVGEQRGDPQCDTPRGLTLHGLWPQRDDGLRLEYCTPGARLTPALLARVQATLLPSPGLATHEWRRHGVCSGDTPARYFENLARAFAAVNIPTELAPAPRTRRLSARELRAAWQAANPGLPADGLALICDGQDFVEARLCLGKDLRFRACAADVRDRCGDTLRLRVFTPD